MNNFATFQSLRFCFFAIVLPAVTCRGQDPPAIKAEVVTLCDTGVMRDLHFLSKRKPQTMTVYSRGFSPPISYEGAAELIFYNIPPVPDESGFEVKPIVLAQVTLPANASRVLLLFERNTESSEPKYRIQALNNDFSRFTPGSYRFFNTTSSSLLGFLGKTRFEIAPKMTKIVEATGTDEHNNVELRIYRKNPETGVPGVVYQSVWNVKESRRSNVFMATSNSRNTDLMIRKIVEPVVANEEKETNPAL